MTVQAIQSTWSVVPTTIQDVYDIKLKLTYEVDVPVPNPVSLDMIKKEPKLKEMALIKFSRLSVQPVTPDEWKLVCKMGGVKG